MSINVICWLKQRTRGTRAPRGARADDLMGRNQNDWRWRWTSVSAARHAAEMRTHRCAKRVLTFIRVHLQTIKIDHTHAHAGGRARACAAIQRGPARARNGILCAPTHRAHALLKCFISVRCLRFRFAPADRPIYPRFDAVLK